MVDAHSACHCFLGIAEASRVYRRYSGYTEMVSQVCRGCSGYLSPSSTDLYFRFSSIFCQHKTQKAKTIKTTNNNLYRNVLQYGSFSTIQKKLLCQRKNLYNTLPLAGCQTDGTPNSFVLSGPVEPCAIWLVVCLQALIWRWTSSASARLSNYWKQTGQRLYTNIAKAKLICPHPDWANVANLA